MPGRTGIIPARAGFTAGCSGGRGSGWDHPRSRGVYSVYDIMPHYATGSSPLARGLPVDHSRERGRPRIIPARAGFTWSRHHADDRARDHPRSRGVYMQYLPRMTFVSGSSPLARGLQIVKSEPGHNRWIIPARAGFTQGPLTPILIYADHPRSRGVYVQLIDIDCAVEGSSPLARGLLARHGDGATPTGIIPARAGFTGLTPSSASCHTDHPRSRGVYRRRRRLRVPRLGSSPLARGLHRIPVDRELGRRIIPARAGFTIRFRTPR